MSLTGRCNLRCVCCMPEGMVFAPGEEVLTDDEDMTVMRAAAERGVPKIRLVSVAA